MKRLHYIFSSLSPELLALLLVTVAIEANAAVYERDWKLAGDGLLTYDDVNQREWLDLTASDIANFDPPNVTNAVGEIRPGGLFEGFVLADVNDVTALAQSAGLDTDSHDFALNATATRHLITLLGPTLDRPDEDKTFAVGWLGTFLPLPQIWFCPCRASANFGINPDSGANGMAGLFISVGDDLASARAHAGLMLYRNVVPEPSTLALMVLALDCLLLARFSSREKRKGHSPPYLHVNSSVLQQG